MTTRPGAGAQDWLRKAHTMRLCNLVRIVRSDGVEACFSDHDRAITFEGRTYLPAIGAGMSAERREGALRVGTQDLYGVVDGVHVQLPDLHGERYRGAEVFHVIARWDASQAPIARHRKFIRHVTWTGSTFIGQLESRSQVLQRPSGGRFGGTFSPTCPYKLGGPFCRKDISAHVRSAVVTAVLTERMEFTCWTVAWPTATSNDFYRDGEIEWRWGPGELMEVDRGIATAGTTTTSVVDSSQSWVVNEHVGRRLLTMTANWGAVVEYGYVTANTATTLTLVGPGLGSLASGVYYMLTARGISSAATSTTLTDSTATWVTNEHAGKFARIFTIAGGDGEITTDAEIASNTATVLTFTGPHAGFTGLLAYDIAPPSSNFGTVSPVVGHVDASRKLSLLIPTPFAIEIGGGGWVRPGCDGLLATCIAKFDNVDNFGGDKFQPNAQQVMEPPEDQ